MRKKLILQAGLHAVCQVIYVAIVTLVMSNTARLLGDKPGGAIGPVAFLTLLVTSVAVSGALIFGRPVLLYLDGKKKQSIEFFAYTIGWLILILIIIFGSMFILK